MLKKLRSINEKIDGIVSQLESQEIEGPIPYLEEAKEIIDQAIEEYEFYESELNSDED